MMGTPDSKTLIETAANRKDHRFMADNAWNTAPNGETETGAQSATLHGLSGSPGVVKGPVKIIHGPEEL